MIEILKIFVTVMGLASVSNGTESATMLSFEGEAESEYFHGATLPGGVDTQMHNADGTSLSARYILEGVDMQGDSCRIFIENNMAPGDSVTHPRIITDSKSLGFLNGAELIGKIGQTDGKLTIHIFAPSGQ